MQGISLAVNYRN